jgi:hypothetical protein
MTNFQSNTTPWINREKLLIGLPAGLGVVLALILTGWLVWPQRQRLQIAEQELEQLDDLFRLTAVEIVTAEDHSVIAYGKPRLVVGQARCGEAVCSEAELPSIAHSGGSFDWRELAAALRLTF